MTPINELIALKAESENEKKLIIIVSQEVMSLESKTRKNLNP